MPPGSSFSSAVLLFFHEHSVSGGPDGMSHQMQGMMHTLPAGAHHMMSETMLRIKKQHFWFSMVGFGVAFFKFLSDGGFWQKPFVRFLWPAFISLLGIFLMLYTE
jgi:hypothetical protein